LAGLPDVEVHARDRGAPQGQTDQLLANLDMSDFDQLWLFAVDTGEGLNADECAGISRFRKSGRGLMVTRDHMDLGSSVCTLGGVGEAHHFHTRNPEADPARQVIDDRETAQILWPNYHSGANGDVQTIAIVGEPHPVLRDPESTDGTGLITRLPSHPHEGAVAAPPGDRSARVIATGKSKVTGAEFNIAVAFEPSIKGGPAIAQSTFHHFADYNLDPRLGAPSFVTEPAGFDIVWHADAARQARRYYRNLAEWLAGGRG
ncbi:MAG: hypothetical protein ABIO37_12495, partial [Caulobacteraceae bacterium]